MIAQTVSVTFIKKRVFRRPDPWVDDDWSPDEKRAARLLREKCLTHERTRRMVTCTRTVGNVPPCPRVALPGLLHIEERHIER